MREGNRDAGRERVPHISQLIGHSRSSRYQNPFSKTLTMKCFSSRNCTSGYISHPIIYKKNLFKNCLQPPVQLLILSMIIRSGTITWNTDEEKNDGRMRLSQLESTGKSVSQEGR